jgi:hypothetical protein
VLGDYNPVEYIAQISPTPLLLPARNDALAPAADPGNVCTGGTNGYVGCKTFDQMARDLKA